MLALFLAFSAAICSQAFSSHEETLSSVEQRLQEMEKFSKTLQAPRAAFGPNFLGEDLFAITSEKEYSFNIQTFNFFVARLPMRQTQRKPAVKTFRKQSAHLLVTTDEKGTVQVWNMDQDLLAEYDTQTKQMFTASQVHSGNHNILLLGLATGEVKVYSMAIWRTSDLVENVEVGIVNHLTLPFHTDVEAKSSDEESEPEKPEKCESAPSVTSIGVYVRRNHEKMLVGYDNGEIHSFEDNGDWKRKWSSGNETIQKIVVGPKSETLVLTEAGFIMIQSHKLTPSTSFCSSPKGIKFEDAVFDAKFSDVFYISTNNGTVYAYRRRSKICKVVKKMDMGLSELSHISSIEGHLLVGSAKDFNAFNVTSKRLRNVQKSAFRQEFVLKDQPADSSIDFQAGVDGYGVAGVALRRGNSVSIWEGFVILNSFSQEGGGSGFDFFSFATGVGRIPIFILVIACVFGWQWYNKKQRAKAFEERRSRRNYDPMQFSDFQVPNQPRHIGKNIDGLSARTAELDTEIQRLQQTLLHQKQPSRSSPFVASPRIPKSSPVEPASSNPFPVVSKQPASKAEVPAAKPSEPKDSTSI